MTKKFTLVQLFSLVDGRLSTNIGDVYDMLNHICDDNLMTHHLPVAMDYVKEKNPKWFGEVKARLDELGIQCLIGDLGMSVNELQTLANKKKDDERGYFRIIAKYAGKEKEVEKAVNLIGTDGKLVTKDEVPFEQFIAVVRANDAEYDIPQLKDEYDTMDFSGHMVGNSLLLKKFA